MNINHTERNAQWDKEPLKETSLLGFKEMSKFFINFDYGNLKRVFPKSREINI